MPVLVRIAFRNLLEHKSKSLIIGVLIAVGVVVLIVGNSFMDTAALGIERAFINNYTGHVMISGVADGKVSLFGVQSPGKMEDTPVIPEFTSVFEHIQSLQGIEAYTPQLTGYGIIGLPDTEGRTFSLLFGIEPSTYRKMFDNVDFIEGRFLRPGEEGLMMSVNQIDRLKKEIADKQNKSPEDLDITIHEGDIIRVSSYGNAGFKIREVPVRGIFTFKGTSEGVGADMITYVDPRTVRALQGLSVETENVEDLVEDETQLLSEENPEDLFTEGSFVVEKSETVDFSEQGLSSILNEEGEETSGNAAESAEKPVTAAPAGNSANGPWQYILLKLENPKHMTETVMGLNLWFHTQKIAARAGTWEDAAGPFATTADVIRTVFNIAIIIIGIVAVIIMMNTLVISVIERTPEIGTMRALGARKGFVWKMFLIETLTITIIFGIIGIVLAVITVGILNAIGIEAHNTFLKILFAGDVLRPRISGISVLTSILIVSAIGFIAHLYPVSVALKIQPIKAIHSK